MRSSPEISVVMAVHNGGAGLRATIESVLAQEGVTLEFIVVDDGSTDATPALLDGYAKKDDRVRILTQENQGLTRALIAGCAAAHGACIARQDCSDVSLPGRLRAQWNALAAAPDAVMVSCGTRFVGPEGEPLYTVTQSSGELAAGLSGLTLEAVRGPSHHGSTMFRRDVYDRVGGYRAAFRVAQDLDLWMRFAEAGRVIAIPDVLYEAKLLLGSISMARREAQLAAAATILACAAARRDGRSDDVLLSTYQTASATIANGSEEINDARFYYFIAGLLRRQQPARSRHYYMRSLQASKLFAPAWLGLFRTLIAR